MVNFSDSIDTTIFVALQISRTCLDTLGRQTVIYFSSNPGCGKSTAVMEYCKIHGYHLELLRISNETPDTITGYDIAADTNNPDITSAKHIRPSWFEKILRKDKEGISSVLFLDEISSADVFTQAAALNICFERRVGAHEFLPESCLVVAAGNYADNLSTEFTIIGPMLNRFIVVNIQPQAKDLKHFLCKYAGAAAGQRINLHNELSDVIDKLREHGIKNPTEEFIGRIGEVIEQAIKIEAEVQIKEGISDLTVTELKDIYSNFEDNEAVGLPGFITFRSLNYLVDACVACYLNFGKAGLLSDNFKKIIHGTVGLALSRDKDHTLKKTIVTDRYYSVIMEAANDIEKMNNDKLPEYINFFNDIVKDDSVVEPADMVLLTKKIQEMMADKDLSKLDRPIDPEILKLLFKNLEKTLKNWQSKASKNMVQVNQTTNELGEFELDIDTKFLAGWVNSWNSLADLITEVVSVIKDPKKRYQRDTTKNLEGFVEKLRRHQGAINQSISMKKKYHPELAEMIPTVNQILNKNY